MICVFFFFAVICCLIRDNKINDYRDYNSTAAILYLHDQDIIRLRLEYNTMCTVAFQYKQTWLHFGQSICVYHFQSVT